MTVEHINIIAEHVRACVKRLGQAAQVTVASLMDEQVDQETVDARVEAVLLAGLLPEPWNPTWDM